MAEVLPRGARDEQLLVVDEVCIEGHQRRAFGQPTEEHDPTVYRGEFDRPGLHGGNGARCDDDVGAMAGGVGGVLVQLLVGYLTDLYVATPKVAYGIMFIVCALTYIITWSLMKLLVPRHRVITDL